MRFVDGNAINPGSKGAVAAEASHVAENLQKYFLYNIRCIGGIAQKTPREVIDRRLEASNQLFVGFFVTRLKT